MSKILKKIAGPKTLVSVKMDSMELMGSAVAEKDMFCVHWTMKGLRGRESTGDTENVRAAVSDGVSYPVARFNDVFAGEVHPKARKDGSGYDAMEFEMRVVAPALHKKDEKIIGKAIVNIFEKVPALTPGQPHQAEQTVGLTKDGTAVAHIKLTLSVKGDAPADDVEVVEADQPTSPSSAEPPASPQKEVPNIVIKTAPATPQKEAGSELGGSSGTSEVKEESKSKSGHRKRRSSNSSAMMAAQLKRKEEELKQKEEELKQKEEELKQKDEELKQKDEELKQKDEELKKKDEEAQEKQKELEKSNNELTESRDHNAFLESRVKELEQANEKTDVVPLDAAQERMQEDITKLVEKNESLEEQRSELLEELKKAKQQIEELEAHSDKKELDLLNQQLSALQEELAKTKKDLNGGAAPAKSGMMMQVIVGAIGAVVGIIIGHMI